MVYFFSHTGMGSWRTPQNSSLRLTSLLGKFETSERLYVKNQDGCYLRNDSWSWFLISTCVCMCNMYTSLLQVQLLVCAWDVFKWTHTYTLNPVMKSKRRSVPCQSMNVCLLEVRKSSRRSLAASVPKYSWASVREQLHVIEVLASQCWREHKMPCGSVQIVLEKVTKVLYGNLHSTGRPKYWLLYRSPFPSGKLHLYFPDLPSEVHFAPSFY